MWGCRMTDKEKFKLYFEFDQRKEEIKQTIAELEAEKQYIIDTLKATRIKDMPTAHNIGDISNIIAQTDEIDTLIQQQTMQLQMVHKIYLEIKERMDKLNKTQKIVLESRIYGAKVFYISSRINIGDATYFRIRNEIKQKIGLEI